MLYLNDNTDFILAVNIYIHAHMYQIVSTAIPVPIVNAIFKITEYLDLGPNARYIAIHLYDKFMCNYFWEVYNAQAVDQNESSWSEVCKKISSQSKLYLMSCLQVASKVDSHSKSLGISQVHISSILSSKRTQ